MKLSVIIPAYITSEKGAKDLALLVEEVAGQINPEEHEIVVVDDASPEIKASDLEFPGVAYYRPSENSGVAIARNFGIDNTTGDYIVFLDADDDIPEDFIAILSDRIACETQQDGRADIVQFKAQHEDGNIAYPEPCAWGKLIKREWIGEDRFDPDQLIGEEDTLFLKEGKSKIVVFDERIIYYHRQSANPDSLMKRFWRGEVPRRRER